MSRIQKQSLVVFLVVSAVAFALYQTGVGGYVKNGWAYFHDWMYGSSFPAPVLTNDADIAMMTTVSSVKPNPFGTFEESLAALPIDMRKMVLAYHDDDETRRLTARAWAMTKRHCAATLLI